MSKSTGPSDDLEALGYTLLEVSVLLAGSVCSPPGACMLTESPCTACSTCSSRRHASADFGSLSR